jgi:RimJ/RimL family protein N-acetyltransferase
MMETMAIETPRLLLRAWRDSDRAPFHALNADPRVMEFFPFVLSRDQSDAMAERCQRLIAERGWGFWAVETRLEREFIGFIGLHAQPDALPFSPCVEIGWRLAHAHWGRGYASEGALAALRTGFDCLGLDEIVSFTALANQRSRAVMERIGMLGAGAFDHPALPAGHPLRRHCLYRIRQAAPA